jgi:zinc protease
VIETPPHMATQPHVGMLPPLRTPSTTGFTLSNGLEVVAIARTVAPIVSMSLMIRSGADSDVAGREGLASATAEMLDEGAGVRSALEVAEELEQIGADLYVGAGRDGSQLTLQVPSKELARALAIASDVVIRPRLTPQDWGRVQHDRLTALSQRRDQPEAVANLISERTLFGRGHPYGFPVDGIERSVSEISADDVRRCHERLWLPNNATVVISGDLDLAALPDQLERAFGTWQAREVAVARPTPPFPDLPRLVLIDRPGAPQSIIRILGRGEVRNSPDRPALGALNAILGGSFTSRLNFNLREQKGYTYGAGSSFGFYRRAGSFTARAAVFTEVTAPAVTEFLREIAAIRAAPVTPTELTKARATLLGRVAEGLSTSGGIAAQYAELRLYNLPIDEPARFVAALESATADDLQRLARRYLDPDGMAIVVVGDRAAIEAPLRALGLPAPMLRDTDGDPLPPT